jgi:rubrerythrin
MVDELNIKLNKKLLELLDKRRGDLSREGYVDLLLKESLNSSEGGPLNLKKLKNGIKNQNSNEDDVLNSDDLIRIIEDFQEFANKIYTRLDRLEEMVETNHLDFEKLQSNRYSLKLDDEEEVESEDVIFEVLEDSQNDSETVFKEDESSDYFEFNENNDSEFEYGCPFCNATITENADQCPKCGNKFDDFDSSDYMEVTPLSVGYNDSGNYDPRPDYLKRREGRYYPPEQVRMEKPVEATPMPTPEPDYRKRPPPLCEICGGKLSYVEDFKRWYCHRCKKYSGGPPPVVKPDSYSVSKVPSKVESGYGVGVAVYTHDPSSEPVADYDPEPVPVPENKAQRPSNMARKRVHPKNKDWRPLKDYKKYKE